MRTERMMALPAVCFWLAVASGCHDADVSFTSCTNLSNDTRTGARNDRGSRGCNGTVVVIAHDAPLEALQAFHLTITRVELVSEGRVFVIFEGSRRENLLEFREQGFLLARREDVPEVEFDTLRVRLRDPSASPDPGGAPLSLAADGEVEVPLDPPLAVEISPRRLRIDIDVAEMLSESHARGPEGLLLVPVVRAHTDDGIDTDVSLAPTRGKVLAVSPERGRVLLEAEDGGGTYWASLSGAGLMDRDGRSLSRASFAPGQEVILEGYIQADATLLPSLLILSGH
ncbi:MAG TPA: DUF4382 domain-containing protein [Planctomycetota bacterium]|nr:DUF4382 domain-containing protein [Planctomycetota bacterium]